jgi:NAD-dependent DNA ligase
MRAQNAINEEHDGLFYAMHQQREEMLEQMQFMQAQQTKILQNQQEMRGYYNRWESSEERRQQQLDNVIQELGGLRLQFDNFQNDQQPPP